MASADISWRRFVSKFGAANLSHALGDIQCHGFINQIVLATNYQAEMFQAFSFQIIAIILLDNDIICQRPV